MSLRPAPQGLGESFTDVGLLRSAEIVAREANRVVLADALKSRADEADRRRSPANAYGLQPLHTCILIEFDPAPEETAGGIILPHSQAEVPPGIATVLAVGPGCVIGELELAYSETLDTISLDHTVIERDGNVRILKPPSALIPGCRVIVQRYGGMVVPRPDHCNPHARWQHQLVRVVMPELILCVVSEAPTDGEEEAPDEEEARPPFEGEIEADGDVTVYPDVGNARRYGPPPSQADAISAG